MRNIAKRQKSPFPLARATLACLAFFFCMRSCEYSRTTSNESKRTQILKVKNFRFFKNKRLLSHSNPALATADLVDVTFEFQKNDDRNESVGMHSAQATRDFMCPVKLAAEVVQRVRSYPGSTDDSPINLMMTDDGKIFQITSKSIRTQIKTTVEIIGPKVLGFSKDDVGTHSIRSGGAMALHLAGVSPLTIMLIGRWRSEAFLLYIRKQVQKFSEGLSDRMLQTEDYFTTPDYRNISGPAAPVPAFESQNIHGLSHKSLGTWRHPSAISAY